MYPTVAIIGQPNVGKSSLLNAMAKSRISIVEETPGITRDRVSVTIRTQGRVFDLVDTGGIGIIDQLELSDQIHTQIDIAIRDAHLILFVIDIKAGVDGLDVDIAKKLRSKNKPVLLVLNKCDTQKLEADLSEYYRLGFGDPLPISVLQSYNVEVLKGRILEKIPVSLTADEETPEMRIALVGKTNTGKSTFFNQLVGYERMIVSEIPGTTRDSVDMRFQKEGKTFIAIDTAGFRKTKAVDGTFEFYSQKRSEKSIRRADVILFFLDVTKPMSKVDKQLANFIREEYKPVVIIANKWDLAGDLPTSEYARYITRTLRGLTFAPIVFVTAKEGKNVQSALDVAQSIWKQSITRVQTPQINKVLGDAYQRRKPPPVKGQLAKFFYGTQVSISPPTLVLFVNKLGLVPSPYLRYLENQFRELLPFNEIPIRLIFRNREQNILEKE